MRYSTRYIIVPLLAIIGTLSLIAISLDFPCQLAKGEYNEQYKSCEPVYNQAAVIIGGIIDITMCSILLSLFIHPLVKLSREVKLEHHVEQFQVSSHQLSIDVSKAKKDASVTNVSPFPIGNPQLSQHSSSNISSCQSCETTPISMEIELEMLSLGLTTTGDSIWDSCIDEEKELSFPDVDVDVQMEVDKRQDDFIRNHKSKHCAMSSHQQRLNGIYDELISRYALLVILCICTSFLLYLSCILFGHWIAHLSPIDDAINVWCIVLIDKRMNKLYHRLCYPCDFMMKLCCDARINLGLQDEAKRKEQSVVLTQTDTTN